MDYDLGSARSPLTRWPRIQHTSRHKSGDQTAHGNQPTEQAPSGTQHPCRYHPGMHLATATLNRPTRLHACLCVASGACRLEPSTTCALSLTQLVGRWPVATLSHFVAWNWKLRLLSASIRSWACGRTHARAHVCVGVRKRVVGRCGQSASSSHREQRGVEGLWSSSHGSR